MENIVDLEGISGLSALDDDEDWEEEQGEAEFDEKSDSSAGINFNKKNNPESDSEEEDIIKDAIKKNRAKLEDLDEEHGPAKKRRKVDMQKTEEHFKTDAAELTKNLGKTAAIPEKEKDQVQTFDFEYVSPNEAYFHIVKVLLNQYLDGEHQEKLDLSAMSDFILERASIGSVIASSLGKEDPETNPKYAKLSDKEFDKICLTMNQKRDVYGLISILSLSYSSAKIPWLKYIKDYFI